MARGKVKAQGHRALPLLPFTATGEVTLELEDNSVLERSAVSFFQVSARDPNSTAARLAGDFIQRNRPLLDQLDVRIEREFDGRDVALRLHAGNTVGAIPLFSPSTARMDYGLIVQPRFPWRGIGPMLADMGWRVSPSPLRLPLLRRSERRVPAWVLSSMILARLDALLKTQDRRFEMNRADLPAPRGHVHWDAYASSRLPAARWTEVPCSFPDLRHNRQLFGAVRFALEKQLRSLESQREHGPFVHHLLDYARGLWQKVAPFPARVPSPADIAGWLHRPLRTPEFVDGIESIQWVADDRGLAGASDLDGVPWRMPMEAFYEAWVETVLATAARQTGGLLHTGRNRETVHALDWRPGLTGAQRALIPDFRIDYPAATVIVDAKYKRHFDELQFRTWHAIEDEIREQHRHDLLQILAYSSLAPTDRAVLCLAYPCAAERWQSLRDRNRLHHRAEISVGPRSIHLWLTAIPMSVDTPTVAAELTAQLRHFAA